MSPSKEKTGGATQSATLKIQKESHVVHKASCSSSSASSFTSFLSATASSTNSAVSGITTTTNRNDVYQKQQRQPVIIYTQTPKVIHTHAKDFMALVQKLTGLSRCKDEDCAALEAAAQRCRVGNSGERRMAAARGDDSCSSSSENYSTVREMQGSGQPRRPAPAAVKVLVPPPGPSDAPVFAPNPPPDMFSHLYRYLDGAVFSPRSMGVSMSPFVMGDKRALHEQ